MGLSSFDHYSTPTPYCSPSIDRSMTTRLIESSNIPPKSSSRFAHTPEWADGLDSWSSSQVCTTKTELTRRHFDFHRDLGLYLPRHEKPSSAPTSLKNLQINSKLTRNHFPPERIQQLINKEKDLLLQNDLSNQKIPIETHLTLPTNTFRQSTSTEKPSTNEVRLPLRHISSKSTSPPRFPSPPVPPPQPPLNQDTLKTLLKEHLTSLLTHGASTINTNHRSMTDVRQQIRTESKLIDELTPPPQQTKTNQTSPLVFHHRSTLGLTVTPVDLSSQRNIHSVSIEKMAQQRNLIQDSESSSTISTRPATQPAPIPPPPTHLYQQQQRVVLRKNLEGANFSPGDLIVSNESSQTVQNTRKGQSNNRSPKTRNHRAAVPATIELLPPIISGKRLHIPLANHRYL